MLGKHTLQPNDKTDLKIVYKTAGLPGAFRKTITISTNGAGQEEIELTLFGTVREAPGAKIQVQPRKNDFGSIKSGSIAKLQYTVTNKGTLPLIITKIHSPERNEIYYDRANAKEIVIDAGKSEVIKIDIVPLIPGPFMERIIIVSNAKNTATGNFIIMAAGRVE